MKVRFISKMYNKLLEYILYNFKESYYVIYLPSRHCGGMYPIGDKYLNKHGHFTYDILEAKRFWKWQYTINIWTSSKKIK